MSCEENKLIVSRLLDAEVQPEQSAFVFTHLATCAECRSFFHRVQELHRSMQRIAEPVIAPPFRKTPVHLPADNMPRTGFWLRQVSLRIPIVVLTACVVVAAVLFSFKRSQEPERVYVTELPTVIVAADNFSAEPKK